MNNAYGFYESDVQNDLKVDFLKRINILENKIYSDINNLKQINERQKFIEFELENINKQIYKNDTIYINISKFK